MALRNPHFRLFAGAFLISFSPVFVKLVTVSPTVAGFYRTLFGGTALVIYLLATRGRRPSRSSLAALGAAATFFALDLWFWHRSILLIGPGLATLLANLQVFFMMAAGMIVWRERPTASQAVAAPLAMFGLALILGRDWFGLAAGYRRGVVLGVLTAMAYAGYLLSMRRARRDESDPVPAPEVAVVSLLVAGLLGLAALAEGNPLAIPTPGDLGWLLCYGIAAHAFGLMLIGSALTEVTAAEVGIALLLQPTLSLVWDIVLFDRAISGTEAVGIAVTLGAIFLGSQRRAS